MFAHSQYRLTASDTALAALIDSTEDMIWTVDAERFGFTAFNLTLVRYFANRRGLDIRFGMTPDEISPGEIADWWKRAYARARDTGPYEIDYQVPSSDRILHMSFNRLVQDGRVFGISVFGKDITDRERIQRALQASEARYRDLVESAHDWVWEVNAGGIYTFVGPQCRGILGYAPEEIVGKRPFDLMPPDEAQRVAEVFNEIAAERKPFYCLENLNLHKDGHLVVLETNGIPFFGAAGEFLGYRGMDRDITARKQAEAEHRNYLLKEKQRMVEHVNAVRCQLQLISYSEVLLTQAAGSLGQLTGEHGLGDHSAILKASANLRQHGELIRESIEKIVQLLCEIAPG